MKSDVKVNESELFRILRTRIQLAKEDLKTIGVVSNDLKDGKTQVAFSLAESFAKTGKKVLLVDGNLRHSDLSSQHALESKSGLSQLLKGSGTVASSVVKTPHDNLYLLPTKEAASDSTELLERVRLSEIFEEVKNLYDLIVVDTPAVNTGMDALLLSRQCDGVIYVIAESRTRSSELKDNKILFYEAGIDILGAVWRADTV